VPQIFIGDESIGGFVELKALSDRGELATKLAD
jgi:glutaredoxin